MKSLKLLITFKLSKTQWNQLSLLIPWFMKLNWLKWKTLMWTKKEDDQYDDFLASIGELFATTGSNTTPMIEDATILNPSFSGKCFFKEWYEVEPLPTEDLNCIIQFWDAVAGKRNKRGEFNDASCFVVKTSELNTLVMQQWVIPSLGNNTYPPLGYFEIIRVGERSTDGRSAIGGTGNVVKRRDWLQVAQSPSLLGGRAIHR